MYFRQKIPINWKIDQNAVPSAQVGLVNDNSHKFTVQVVDHGILRIAHELPDKYECIPVDWTATKSLREIAAIPASTTAVKLSTDVIDIAVSWEEVPRVEVWDKAGNKIHSDMPLRSYSYDASNGSVYHYISKEWHTPVTEDEASSHRKTPREMQNLSMQRKEFIYGLGESRGPLIKNGKRFRMEARDAMGYDWEEGDTLYKLNPFYIVYNRQSKSYYGLWYNTLNDSEFDMGVETDVQFGPFRTFITKKGPLDYFLIYGDGTLPSIISAYSKLVSPGNNGYVAPDLPPLSQFGYLASSMGMAAEVNAQNAIIDFIKTSRNEGFPMDGLYLSSGWCQNADNDRLYFQWNTVKYPNPELFVRTVEQELGVCLITNIKPWLLTNHKYYKDADKKGAFVKAAQDSTRTENNSSLSYLWSRDFGDHALGSYFDFSSKAGNLYWKDCVKKALLNLGITGVWIDNNEFSSLTDDQDTFEGTEPIWDLGKNYGGGENTESLLGWKNGRVKMGSVGKAVQTMGMAKATYQAYKDVFPHNRPIIVSRSGCTGVHACAHASWAGDNTTTWQALKYSTKMTLSQGLSMGFGLYGHDIGGFAGEKNPSPELMVRWCQQGAWHTRFTVHSTKKISTTMWMYPEIKPILRDLLAFRYRFIPSFYSYYVTHYFRNGWSVLKPIMWYHSKDDVTLAVDEEFLVGDKLLVVPCMDKGKTTVEAYLPAVIDQSEELASWCEIDTGKWHLPSADGKGQFVTLDAPLERCPVLARSGCIMVLGGPCKATVHEGTNERTAIIFARPSTNSCGSFTLIEDDGKTDAHTSRGAYTELVLSYRATAKAIEVEINVVHEKYVLPYKQIEFQLAPGDRRTLLWNKHESTSGSIRVDV